MKTNQIVSEDEWLAARKAYLAKEKAFTRLRDQLSAERRKLPMVETEPSRIARSVSVTLCLLQA
ncbi:MAG: DUF899 family protein [Gammaproteobacteria bacterium]